MEKLFSIFSQKQETIRIVYGGNLEKNQIYPKNKISNTKYTILTFLPKNLLEQFGRFMNLYFLMIACLQLWDEITPVDPIATWLPLLFIFGISALKEAIDDLRRAASDRRANEQKFHVIRNKYKQKVKSEDLRVGDIVFLQNNEDIPADIVVIKSSDSEGKCFIQTTNIDGETDFKLRLVPDPLQSKTENQIMEFNGVIECAPPNSEIYRFDSRMKVNLSDSEYISLSEEQLLLQATHLRNTDWIYGVIVYTGNETKVGKNKNIPPVKWTKQDKFINKITIFIFCFQLLLVIIFGTVGNVHKDQTKSQLWYLQYPTDEPLWRIFIIPLRFLLLNSMMIPISLKVTMDIVKLCYAKYIDWDISIYDPQSDTPAHATNTAISEDLGQIQYIFSDKTGTLTENRMFFKQCSINNVLYGQNSDGGALDDQDLSSAIKSGRPIYIEFFKALALCHSVEVTQTDKQIIYKATSPDEDALIKAAAHLNVVCCKTDGKKIHVNILNKTKVYEKLQVLEFSSDRRRMSVLFKEPETDRLILYIKGADDVILQRLSSKEDPTETLSHVEQAAGLGLRTLLVGYRYLTNEEYKNWLKIYQEANTSLEERDLKVSQAYELLEKDIQLLGATAIEDKLQYQVPETIQLLRDAGLKIWMLTGDKYTTAVQIAISCNLMSVQDSQQFLLRINGTDKLSICKSISDNREKSKSFLSRSQPYSVIIEGKCLQDALSEKAFLDLCLPAKSVICCRVTPAQKASVVALVKNQNYMTLAIGDGGNDVSMIQQAHVGVGIAGKEGLQAARAADYVLGKFYFLQRLMLVHGRYSVLRSAFVAQYCFYKSLFICFIQILYCFYSGYAGTSFFNTFCLTFYNIVFTGLPILFYVLDKDIDEEHLLKWPQLYFDSQSGKSLSAKTMVVWILKAFFQAAVSFLLTVQIFASHVKYDGYPIDYSTLSLVTFSVLIIVNTCTILSNSNHLTFLNHGVIWGTLIGYFIIMLIYNSATYSNSISFLYSDPAYWFSIFLISFLAAFPVFAVDFFLSTYKPSNSQILKHQTSVPRINSILTCNDEQSVSDRTPLLTIEKRD